MTWLGFVMQGGRGSAGPVSPPPLAGAPPVAGAPPEPKAPPAPPAGAPPVDAAPPAPPLAGAPLAPPIGAPPLAEVPPAPPVPEVPPLPFTPPVETTPPAPDEPGVPPDPCGKFISDSPLQAVIPHAALSNAPHRRVLRSHIVHSRADNASACGRGRRSRRACASLLTEGSGRQPALVTRA